jgi:hypothetical protein
MAVTATSATSTSTVLVEVALVVPSTVGLNARDKLPDMALLLVVAEKVSDMAQPSASAPAELKALMAAADGPPERGIDRITHCVMSHACRAMLRAVYREENARALYRATSLAVFRAVYRAVYWANYQAMSRVVSRAMSRYTVTIGSQAASPNYTVNAYSLINMLTVSSAAKQHAPSTLLHFHFFTCRLGKLET